MTELAKILKGSQNYGLAGPDSDKDYITIITPSLVELYYNKTFATNNEHFARWTLPQFTKRFLTADPTALELCFSCEAVYYSADFYDLVLYLRHQLEDGFLCSVWPQYCSRIFGMIYSDLKNAARTDWVVQRRLKAISRALYYLDLIVSVSQTGGCLTKKHYREQIGDCVPRAIKFEHGAADLESDLAIVRALVDRWKPTLEQIDWLTSNDISLAVNTQAIDIMRKFIK